jgi:two-component system chemotaxis response regulator CheB
VVFGMPGAAIAKKAAEQIVHGDEMSSSLLKLVRGETPAAPR